MLMSALNDVSERDWLLYVEYGSGKDAICTAGNFVPMIQQYACFSLPRTPSYDLMAIVQDRNWRPSCLPMK